MNELAIRMKRLLYGNRTRGEFAYRIDIRVRDASLQVISASYSIKLFVVYIQSISYLWECISRYFCCVNYHIYLFFHLIFFILSFSTSAAEEFPVVITELTFPSVTVESVPFAIQAGTFRAMLCKKQSRSSKSNYRWRFKTYFS